MNNSWNSQQHTNQEIPNSRLKKMRLLIPKFPTQPPAWLENITKRLTGREKTALGVLVLTLIISGVISAVGYIDRNSHIAAQFGGTYKEAQVGQPHYINPILSSANDLDLDLTRLVYSSLFRLNDNLELENDLATDYQISNNGLTYTIHIRQDVSWHDGQPLTAEDVIFTIRSIQTQEYGSPLASSFQGVQAEKGEDNYTVIFTLKQPYSPFLVNLTVGIVPHHVWENIPPKNASLAEQMLKPVGTGPFKFAEITTRRKTGEITEFRLIRNEGYYGKRPYLDEFIVLFYNSQEEATSALLSGTVDGLGFLPLSLAEKFEGRTSFKIEQLSLPQYFGLFFNESKNEALGNAGVRAALSLAVDRDAIVEKALRGYATALAVPIPKGPFNINIDETINDYDPEKAKQNLDEAGWKDTDEDGIRDKDGKPLELKIATTEWPEYIATAQAIQEQWAQIGVATTIEQFGAGTIQQTIVGPRDYEILLYGEILPADPDPYPFWHSTQSRAPGLNLAQLKDAKIDTLLEEARKTNNIQERQEKYREFLARFTDLKPAIILYQPSYLYAHSTALRGQTITNVNLPSARFNEVEAWHIKTKRVWGKE